MIYQCKVCGAPLKVEPGQTVCTCEYCGIVQTVPSVDSERKSALFKRANELRISCQFDKAAGIYESIVSEFPKESEAYWGLILCKNGIEYVDDPKTQKKIPTCHRSQFSSIYEDVDYQNTIKYADVLAKEIYQKEARVISNLQKKIYAISSKEEPYDIFICYKETDAYGNRTEDSVIAQDIYDRLTNDGYRVFFSRVSLEDKLGADYEPIIFAALQSSRMMIHVTTDNGYTEAVWVRNEWSRYLEIMKQDKERVFVPVYKGISVYDLPEEMQRYQGQDFGKLGAIQDLSRGVKKILSDSVSTHNSHVEKVVKNETATRQKNTIAYDVLRVAVPVGTEEIAIRTYNKLGYELESIVKNDAQTVLSKSDYDKDFTFFNIQGKPSIVSNQNFVKVIMKFRRNYYIENKNLLNQYEKNFDNYTIKLRPRIRRSATKTISFVFLIIFAVLTTFAFIPYIGTGSSQPSIKVTLIVFAIITLVCLGLHILAHLLVKRKRKKIMDMFAETAKTQFTKAKEELDKADSLPKD